MGEPTEPGADGSLRVHHFRHGDGEFVAVSARGAQVARQDKLTKTQHEIYVMLACGASNQDVATARGVSVRTVANHVAAIFDRLGVGSRVELACLAWKTESSETV